MGSDLFMESEQQRSPIPAEVWIVSEKDGKEPPAAFSSRQRAFNYLRETIRLSDKFVDVWNESHKEHPMQQKQYSLWSVKVNADE